MAHKCKKYYKKPQQKCTFNKPYETDKVLWLVTRRIKIGQIVSVKTVHFFATANWTTKI